MIEISLNFECQQYSSSQYTLKESHLNVNALVRYLIRGKDNSKETNLLSPKDLEMMLSKYSPEDFD